LRGQRRISRDKNKEFEEQCTPEDKAARKSQRISLDRGTVEG
jgi:hypothetical protein